MLRSLSGGRKCGRSESEENQEIFTVRNSRTSYLSGIYFARFKFALRRLPR